MVSFFFVLEKDENLWTFKHFSFILARFCKDSNVRCVFIVKEVPEGPSIETICSYPFPLRLKGISYILKLIQNRAISPLDIFSTTKSKTVGQMICFWPLRFVENRNHVIHTLLFHSDMDYDYAHKQKHFVKLPYICDHVG